MIAIGHLFHLRGPLVALSVCVLMAQQLIGFVLTASPAAAGALALSVCLSSELAPLTGNTDGKMDPDGAAGPCVCILHQGTALLAGSCDLAIDPVSMAPSLARPANALFAQRLATGPPAARAPPALPA